MARAKWIDPDFRRQSKSPSYCVVCGQAINPKRPHRLVRLIGNGHWVVHPEDEAAYDAAGTADDNMQDCVAKGRHAGAAPQGEDHYHHTLTEQNVRDIRAQHAAGVPPRVLAPKYGVSRKHIGLVVRRKAWKHVA